MNYWIMLKSLIVILYLHLKKTAVKLPGVIFKLNKILINLKRIKNIRKKKKNISLNTSDQEKLNELLDYVEESYSNSLSAFKENSRKIARSNIQTQSNINQFEKDTKFEHFNSLITKQEHNPEISAVYLDVVNQLMQIYHHSQNISRTILGLI